MDDLISREEALDAIDNERKRLIELNMLGAEDIVVHHARHIIEDLPAVDAVQVVRCGECIYWQKPQVRLPDGTYRDYLPDEFDQLLGIPNVTADVGINVAGYCNGHWTDYYVEDGCHEWKHEEDYCQKGWRIEGVTIENDAT